MCWYGKNSVIESATFLQILILQPTPDNKVYVYTIPIMHATSAIFVLYVFEDLKYNHYYQLIAFDSLKFRNQIIFCSSQQWNICGHTLTTFNHVHVEDILGISLQLSGVWYLRYRLFKNKSVFLIFQITCAKTSYEVFLMTSSFPMKHFIILKPQDPQINVFNQIFVD